MAKISEMTQLSPTMAEGTIVKWIKKVGETISPGEVIAEVETDKAVMEMEAYEKATLLAIVAENGSKVKVGAPIAIIGNPGEDVTSLLAEAKAKLQSSAAESTPIPAETPKQNLETPQVKPEPIKTESPAPNTAPVPEPVITKQERKDGRLLASPLAKSIALSNGVDINLVTGTGPQGRITKKDILDFMSSNNGVRSTGSQMSFSDKKIEVTSMRKVIAERLSSSKVNLPHFYLTLEFDADPILKVRKDMNEELKKRADRKKEKPESISVNDFITKACALALREVPQVNSSWKKDHILQHGRVDIGIAVALDGGLITPYVRNADTKGLLTIHSEIKNLAEKARNRKLKPEEYSDGTFTISNLGMFGISHFTAIINEPEAAIMAVGTVVEKPVVKSGSIVVGNTISVTLSCDHRVIDGATGANFLSAFKEFMEIPGTMLL